MKSFVVSPTRPNEKTDDETLGSTEVKCILSAIAEREGLVWVYGSGDDRISLNAISNRFLAKGAD